VIALVFCVGYISWRWSVAEPRGRCARKLAMLRYTAADVGNGRHRTSMGSVGRALDRDTLLAMRAIAPSATLAGAV
jgi:hypothetical protein